MKDNLLKKILKRSKFMVFCILVVIWIVLSMINKNYGTLNNLAAIIKNPVLVRYHRRGPVLATAMFPPAQASPLCLAPH